MKTFLTYLFIFLFGCSYAQDVLEVFKTSPGSSRPYELYTNDVIEYKLKGEHRYKTDVILNMNDSCLLLQTDSVIKLSEIKAFRFHRSSHLLHTFNSVCFIGGIGYISLNMINNLILQSAFKADPKAIYISAGLVTAGLILKLIRVKHIRIRPNTTIRVVHRSYQNLSK